MRFRFSGIVLGILALAVFVLSAPVQKKPAVVNKAEMAQRVREEFRHAWDGYKKYAWGHDALKPLSRKPHDWYGQSLCITPIDSLDALILLGFSDEAKETSRYIVENVSFDKDIFVSNFEITIRLLGGLVSSSQMMEDKKLLALADDLGKRLLPAFNSPTGMPYRFVNLRTGKTRDPVSNPAEIGTLLLEFGSLSRMIGNPVYYEKAKRALTELYKRRSGIGLVGQSINVETGAWTSRESHISGAIDSYYEYLLKCSRLFGDKDCEAMWKKSIAAVNRYLADETDSGLWYRHADMESGSPLATRFGALDAFFPAVLALSGDIRRARALQASCFRMWNVTGIEPEEFDYRALKIINGAYPLRPEIIESAFYLYFFTGASEYQEMGRTFFENLVRYCRTDDGYAALRSVESKEKRDEMESFFFAETLKYLYLLFTAPDSLNLRAGVLTTEAHPISNTWVKDTRLMWQKR
jgi:mannosidase alpha-like ER degradation enhancer 2